MSRSLYRTNSAGGGINRLGSAGTVRTGNSRAGSAGPENRALREQLSYLQHELLISRAETEKATDQLNCLISLIKRAWAGDKTANVHVANIVGVAPPDVITENNGVNNVSVATIPKSRAVNHWAVLTIGLLNREYRRMEKALEAKQLCYLQRRQEYLEDQLLHNRDQMLRLHTQTTPAHTRVGSAQRPVRPTSAHNGVVGEVNFQPAPGQRTVPQERHCTSPVEGLSSRGLHEPIQTHHYGWQNAGAPDRISVNKPPSAGPNRRTSAKYRRGSEPEPESDLTWADLVIEPANSTKMNMATSKAMDGLYRLPAKPTDTDKVQDTRPEEFDEDRLHLAYDDPNRYAHNGLFNVKETLGPEVVSRNKRPLSGKMKQNDSVRARPKSAVSTKQERPLKYETTRPISASRPNPQNHLNNNNKKQPNRVQSAKQYVSPMEKMSYEKNSLHANNIPLERGKSAPAGRDRQAGSANGALSEAARQAEEAARRKARLLLEDPELASLINVDVTQPECIKEFDDELQEMAAKEKDFKLRAVELQKKLGITSGGILYPDL